MLLGRNSKFSPYLHFKRYCAYEKTQTRYVAIPGCDPRRFHRIQNCWRRYVHTGLGCYLPTPDAIVQPKTKAPAKTKALPSLMRHLPTSFACTLSDSRVRNFLHEARDVIVPRPGATADPDLVLLPGGRTFYLQRRLANSLFGSVHHGVQGSCSNPDE